MKQHKILEDLGFKRHDIPENYNELIPCKRVFARPDDTRLHKWKLERKTYGFDERETWNLDRSFAYWLLERLKQNDRRRRIMENSRRSLGYIRSIVLVVEHARTIK